MPFLRSSDDRAESSNLSETKLEILIDVISPPASAAATDGNCLRCEKCQGLVADPPNPGEQSSREQSLQSDTLPIHSSKGKAHRSESMTEWHSVYSNSPNEQFPGNELPSLEDVSLHPAAPLKKRVSFRPTDPIVDSGNFRSSELQRSTESNNHNHSPGKCVLPAPPNSVFREVSSDHDTHESAAEVITNQRAHSTGEDGPAVHPSTCETSASSAAPPPPPPPPPCCSHLEQDGDLVFPNEDPDSNPSAHLGPNYALISSIQTGSACPSNPAPDLYFCCDQIHGPLSPASQPFYEQQGREYCAGQHPEPMFISIDRHSRYRDGRGIRAWVRRKAPSSFPHIHLGAKTRVAHGVSRMKARIRLHL